MKTPPIVIIYNPYSTGPSKEQAFQFAKALKAAKKSIDVTCVATKYAGHSEEMAREYARQNKPYILISSSGDGSYHDMINGVLSVPEHKIITGLLPGGNANDHYNAIHTEDVIDRMLRAQPTTIDTIRVDTRIDGRPWTRYAHSYAGIGLTSHIGETLTKTKLNRFREAWIVASHFFTHSPVKIMRNGRTYRYDSVIFSNIARMSKVLALTENASFTDGKMEVTESESKHFLSLLLHFVRGAIGGFKTEVRVKSYEFTCVRKTSIQLDGEVYYVPSWTKVKVRVERGNLSCII